MLQAISSHHTCKWFTKISKGQQCTIAQVDLKVALRWRPSKGTCFALKRKNIRSARVMVSCLKTRNYAHRCRPASVMIKCRAAHNTASLISRNSSFPSGVHQHVLSRRSGSRASIVWHCIRRCSQTPDTDSMQEQVYNHQRTWPGCLTQSEQSCQCHNDDMEKTCLL